MFCGVNGCEEEEGGESRSDLNAGIGVPSSASIKSGSRTAALEVEDEWPPSQSKDSMGIRRELTQLRI